MIQTTEDDLQTTEDDLDMLEDDQFFCFLQMNKNSLNRSIHLNALK